MNSRINQCGQALLEFALIIPVLVVMLVFTFYGFLVLSDYLTLQTMGHEAARLGAVSNQIVWLTNVGRENAGAQDMVQREINRLGTLYLYTLDAGEEGEYPSNVTVSLMAGSTDSKAPLDPFIRSLIRVRVKKGIPNIGAIIGLNVSFPPRTLFYTCETPLERMDTDDDLPGKIIR